MMRSALPIYCWLLLILLFTAPVIAQTDALKAAGQNSARERVDRLDNPATPRVAQFIDDSGMAVDALVSAAIQSNRELMALRQNIAIIQGRALQAGLRPNPTVGVDYGTDAISANEGNFDFSATFTQPIELAGKRGKRIRVEQLELVRAEKEIAFQERQLSAEIRSQYAEALAAAETLRFAEQLFAINEEALRVTEIRLKEGDVSRLDLNLIKVEVNRLRTQQLQAENRVRGALLQLKILSGLPVEDGLKIRSHFPPAAATNTLTLQELQTAALQNRLDLQAARAAEEVAQARKILAEAEAVPNISLFGSYEQENSRVESVNLPSMVDSEKKIAFGFSIPLPLRNRNQGTIAAAAAEIVQTRHRREFLEQVVKRDVALAFARYQNAREAIALFEGELIPRAQENVKIIRTAYDLGQQNLLEVVAEQRRFIDTQQLYIDTLKESYLSRIELERAVGGPLN